MQSRQVLECHKYTVKKLSCDWDIIPYNNIIIAKHLAENEKRNLEKFLDQRK